MHTEDYTNRVCLSNVGDFNLYFDSSLDKWTITYKYKTIYSIKVENSCNQEGYCLCASGANEWYSTRFYGVEDVFRISIEKYRRRFAFSWKKMTV